MNKNLITRGHHARLTQLAALLSAVALAGCDIDQTQATELPDVDVEAGKLPDYEIVKTEDGELPDVDVEGGQLPRFDVDWMDVDVGLTEKTLQVPKLRLVMEEETFTVPKVDVDWPGHEDELRERTIRAEVEVPHGGYELAIERAYLDGDDLLVVSSLTRTGARGGTPERLSDHLAVTVPDVDVKHFFIGERPDRDFNDQLRFFSGMDELADRIEDARLIYERN